jgi:hypothetical protein
MFEQASLATMPGCVMAALQFLQFAQLLKNPPPTFDGCRSEPQDLAPNEQACYDEALKLLHRYFRVGDLVVPAGVRRGGDHPDNPDSVPVTQ